jgi:hypothetical protein
MIKENMFDSCFRSRNKSSFGCDGRNEIIVTKTMENGNIDVEDVREKALQYKDQLSCLMIPLYTWCFESAIREHSNYPRQWRFSVHGRCEYECASGIN